MKRINWAILTAVLAFASGSLGCAVALTDAGSRVRLAKSDPPLECTEVGDVSAYRVGPNFQENLKNSLKNDAASMGGNYVRLESLTSDGNAAGTAFQCPETPATPRAADAAR